MPWSSIGSRGTTSLKVVGSDLTFSPSATVAAGRVLILCIAWEIDYTRTAEGVSWPAIAVHDNKGNLYTQLGGFSWESYISIHICQPTTAILTSDTITVHHRSPVHTQKALTAWEFAYDTTKRWARQRDPRGFGKTSTALLTQSTWPMSDEALVIAAQSSLGPSTDSYTYDADYTPFDKAGTTGGSDESNITVTASWRIVNAPAGDTATTTRDVARKTDALQVGLYEATYVSDFPRFPILDDFNRADEDPLDNGTWDPFDMPFTCTPGYAGGELAIESNRVRKSVLNPSGAGSQWWTEPLCGCYAENYVSMPVKGQAGIHMDGGGCGHNATMSGYAGFWMPRTSGYWPDDQFMHGYTGNTGLVAGNPLRTWVDQVDGYKFGLQRDSRDGRHFIHGWIDRGGGWEWVSAWNETTFGPDEECRFGISVWGDVATRLDDFGAGASECPQLWVATNTRSAVRQHRILRGT